jgi:hypothetical protein
MLAPAGPGADVAGGLPRLRRDRASCRVIPADHPIANEHLLPPLSPTTAAIHRAAWGVERLTDRVASAFVRLPPPSRAGGGSASRGSAAGTSAAARCRPSPAILATCSECRDALTARALVGTASVVPAMPWTARGLRRRAHRCAHLDRGCGLTPAHIWTGTGLTPCHVCTGTGLTPCHVCTGTGRTYARCSALTRYFRVAIRAQSAVPVLTTPIKFAGRGACVHLKCVFVRARMCASA